MRITKKQESFAQGIAEGMTGADAYRAAYDAGNMSNNAIYVAASKLLDHPKVAQRIEGLKSELASRRLWTREKSVRALVKAYEVAKTTENPSAMTGAIRELNLMHGYNAPEEVHVTNTGQGVLVVGGVMTPEEWERAAKESQSRLVDADV